MGSPSISHLEAAVLAIVAGHGMATYHDINLGLRRLEISLEYERIMKIVERLERLVKLKHIRQHDGTRYEITGAGKSSLKRSFEYYRLVKDTFDGQFN